MLTSIDIPFENYIRRATGGGSKIATVRDTIPALRGNRSLLLADWFRLEGRKYLIEIEQGQHEQPVHARILYGRWLVDCPQCAGANDVDPDEPVYLCTSCGWPGKFAHVEFPHARPAIERLLLHRPIHNRNWFPGETAEQLRWENVTNGWEV